MIAADAAVDPTAWIGPNAYVGAGAKIGARVQVGPGSVVLDRVVIGADTRLVAHVTLCAGVRLGERCLLHPGVVIGADGFGHAPDQGGYVKIPQVGSVLIGDDVEIGANSTIDRGGDRRHGHRARGEDRQPGAGGAQRVASASTP